MDEALAEFIKRTILKIPMTEMMTILKAWNFLSEKQLQTVNFRQRKESLVQDLVLLCEVTAFKMMNLKHHTTALVFFFLPFFESKRDLRQLLSHEGMWAMYHSSEEEPNS